jgi:hypothetical protein
VVRCSTNLALLLPLAVLLEAALISPKDIRSVQPVSRDGPGSPIQVADSLTDERVIDEGRHSNTFL